MNHFRKFAFVFLVLGSSLAIASQDGGLTGSYRLSGKTLIDAPDAEPKNTYFRVYLDGAAASDLYRAMDVAPVKEECDPSSGTLQKSIGGTTCFLSPSGEYQCSFGINLKEQTVESSYVC